MRVRLRAARSSSSSELSGPQHVEMLREDSVRPATAPACRPGCEACRSYRGNSGLPREARSRADVQLPCSEQASHASVALPAGRSPPSPTHLEIRSAERKQLPPAVSTRRDSTVERSSRTDLHVVRAFAIRPGRARRDCGGSSESQHILKSPVVRKTVVCPVGHDARSNV